MIKYPSIEQFRNVVYQVRKKADKNNEKPPVLSFTGTVKLHGTNGAIVRYADGRTQYQSRNRVLSLQSDNNDFMANMMQKSFEYVFEQFEFNDHVAVFGEWAGGNIQGNNIALQGTPRAFYMFGVMVDGQWREFYGYDSANYIYSLNGALFPQYKVDIDFSEPEKSLKYLTDVTMRVENCDPVVKRLWNKEGVGEGVVWTCDTDPWLKFKTKGEKHSVSKVKSVVEIDPQQLENVYSFADYAVTENRLNQMLQELILTGEPLGKNLTGVFITQVINDIVKEESDVMLKSGLTVKQIRGVVGARAKDFFFNKL